MCDKRISMWEHFIYCEGEFVLYKPLLTLLDRLDISSRNTKASPVAKCLTTTKERENIIETAIGMH